jgi:hypothetical protein
MNAESNLSTAKYYQANPKWEKKWVNLGHKKRIYP